MSKKIVRSTKNVTDIEKFSKNVLEENDIVSTQDGKIYITTKKGFKELGTSFDDTSLKKEITNLKTENTKLKNRVTTLETDNTDLKSSVSTLETDNTDLKSSVTELEKKSTDFESRIKALEKPAK